jgi:ATP-dependent exoDNAse (exonuclease V) alpha subunit
VQVAASLRVTYSSWVIGTSTEVRAGEWLDASGRWFVDSKHGQQFKAETLRTTRPNTVEGVQRYLASGLIKGIGPKFAERLVAHFGIEIFEIIEKIPERLREVTGIGAGRQGKILSAWKEQKAVREIMVFLHSHGVTTSRAFRIYKAYGDDSIEKVRENPYRLARDTRAPKTRSTQLERRAMERNVKISALAFTRCAIHRGLKLRRCARMLGIKSSTLIA